MAQTTILEPQDNDPHYKTTPRGEDHKTDYRTSELSATIPHYTSNNGLYSKNSKEGEYTELKAATPEYVDSEPYYQNAWNMWTRSTAERRHHAAQTTTLEPQTNHDYPYDKIFETSEDAGLQATTPEYMYNEPYYQSERNLRRGDMAERRSRQAQIAALDPRGTEPHHRTENTSYRTTTELRTATLEMSVAEPCRKTAKLPKPNWQMKHQGTSEEGNQSRKAKAQETRQSTETNLHPANRERYYQSAMMVRWKDQTQRGDESAYTTPSATYSQAKQETDTMNTQRARMRLPSWGQECAYSLQQCLWKPSTTCLTTREPLGGFALQLSSGTT